jgi:hypothetical protein
MRPMISAARSASSCPVTEPMARDGVDDAQPVDVQHASTLSMSQPESWHWTDEPADRTLKAMTATQIRPAGRIVLDRRPGLVARADHPDPRPHHLVRARRHPGRRARGPVRRRLEPGRPQRKSRRRGQRLRAAGDIHRVHNTSDTTAISIHVYGTDVTRVGSSARRYCD